MDTPLRLWLLVGHIFGFIIWMGTLFSLCLTLKRHGQAGEAAQPYLGPLEKGSGVLMDIGATLTLVFGILLLVLPEDGILIMKGAGFFHVKLVLVFCLFIIHGALRKKIRKFRQGEIKPLGSWVLPFSLLAVLAIVFLIMVRPF